MTNELRFQHGLIGIALATLLLVGCSQEGADWKQAATANTIEAYQAFLQQHPHGAEANQAQLRVQQLSEQRDWQIASATDTADAYRQFLTQHATGQWAQEARLRIENFAQAAGSGTTTVATASGPAAATAPAAAPTPTTGRAAASVAPSAARASAPPPLAARQATNRVAKHVQASARKHPESQLAATHWVQLGAFKTRTGAQSQWRVLAAHFSSLRSLKPSYVAVRSARGKLYGLRVRLSSATAAEGLCATLKRHARSCVRVNA